MADALAKYRAALKRYRKDNPKVPYTTAQKRVSAEMKSGKVSGVKKKRKTIAAASHKTAIAGPKRKTGARRKAVSGTAKKASGKIIGRIERGEALVREINRLEKKRAAYKQKELQDIVQLEINRAHDQLDALKKSYKRKSA